MFALNPMPEKSLSGGRLNQSLNVTTRSTSSRTVWS